MHDIVKGLTAAALGIGLLAALPANAIESSEWLQRQLSTHHEAHSISGLAQHSRTSESHTDARSSHAVATDWIERQIAGKAPRYAQADGVAGPAGPVFGPAPKALDAEAWLRRQFSTDHSLPGR